MALEQKSRKTTIENQFLPSCRSGTARRKSPRFMGVESSNCLRRYAEKLRLTPCQLRSSCSPVRASVPIVKRAIHERVSGSAPTIAPKHRDWDPNLGQKHHRRPWMFHPMHSRTVSVKGNDRLRRQSPQLATNDEPQDPWTWTGSTL